MRQRSRAIGIARVLCICGIVYVHAWTGLVIEDLRAQGSGWQSIFYWTLIELIGRSSVPLLSIISGWLVASSVEKRSYGSFVANKANSLILPMILWNLVSVSMVMALATWGELRAPTPSPIMPLLNEIFHFTAAGQIDVQNAFLRDIFICMMFAPLLVRLPNRALAVVLGGALLWSLFGWQLYLLLRPQILLFFLIGMFVRRYRLDMAAGNLLVWPLFLLFLVAGAGKVWMSVIGQQQVQGYPVLVAAFDNGLRLLAALLYWRLSLRLAAGRWAAPILKAEPYSFLLFCSHVLIIWLLFPVIGPWFGRFGQPGYPAFLLLQPVFALAAAIVLGQALLRIWPAAAKIMSGGRLKSTAHQ